MSVENRIFDIAGLYAVNNINYKNLYGFHNQVYQITGDTNFILRIASSVHRSKEETLSEIDFLLFLKEKGISLSSPIKGLDGEYVYEITNGNEKYIISAFEIVNVTNPYFTRQYKSIQTKEHTHYDYIHSTSARH